MGCRQWNVTFWHTEKYEVETGTNLRKRSDLGEEIEIHTWDRAVTMSPVRNCVNHFFVKSNCFCPIMSLGGLMIQSLAAGGINNNKISSSQSNKLTAVPLPSSWVWILPLLNSWKNSPLKYQNKSHAAFVLSVLRPLIIDTNWGRAQTWAPDGHNRDAPSLTSLLQYYPLPLTNLIFHW